MMEAKRLIILVEGDCELQLMKKWVIPFLYMQVPPGMSWSLETFKITTNRQLHKKGGNIRYAYLENEVRRISAQGCTLLTTFFDYFRLPADFPGYAESRNVEILESKLNEALKKEIENLPSFIPYIQMYEFEALLFSDIKGFDLILDDEEKLKQIQAIMEKYPNPEEINGNPETAPSKRLAKIFNYDKVADSEIILEMVGLDQVCKKCPRFNQWLSFLCTALNSFE